MRSYHVLTLALAASVLVACGENNDPPEVGSNLGDGGSGPTSSATLLPWSVGNSWTYKVTEDGQTSSKVTTIGAEEPVGGSGPHKDALAFKVVTTKGAADMTISWQAHVEDRIVRYREQSFHEKTGALELEEHWDPAKLHVDDSAAHKLAGASWLEDYSETKHDPATSVDRTSNERDRWTIESSDQTIVVPAGTFRAVVIHKAGGSSAKTYWYVPGVGKVKETGGQTEELMSYEVKP